VLADVHVLVVDDEVAARELVKRLLEMAGATVSLASSATEAIDRILVARPDVLVSDIGMPTEDGYSLIRRLRVLEESQANALPAVALTAYARSEDRTKAIRAGFQNHLSKPVEPAELLAIVASLAGRRVKIPLGD
jgi:CheY-like chemotaxis protein